MIDRNYILNMAKSRDMTIDEFNYDKLVAPPIGYYFSQMDIQRLYEIATSLRYSAKPQVKYQEIDKVMRSRGFIKLAAGTNRLVYRCIENDTFVAKVAYDSVALNDNPREFINQNYLKPFCAKTFEVTPNGVLAFAERVDPITNREEFLSVAEGIFTLITEFIIGEYVMDDIGTRYFMNYGMRRGFGPVVLDYSFLYRLDGNKLFCNKPDNNKPEGKCLGEIDYDAGYNHLICKRCGKIYKARDLELKVKENSIITKSVKGAFNQMKVTISGGSKNYDVTTQIDTTTVVEPKEEVKEETVYVDKQKSVHVSLGHKRDVVEENTPRVMKVSLSSKIDKVPEVKEEKKEETPTVEVTIIESAENAEVEPTVIVEEKKPIKSPIIDKGPKKNAEDYIRDDFNDVCQQISTAHMNFTLNDNVINQVVSGIRYVVDTIRGSQLWTAENDKLIYDIIFSDNLKRGHKIEIEDGKIISTYTVDSEAGGDIVNIYTDIHEDLLPEVEAPVEAEVDTENYEESAKEIVSETTEYDLNDVEDPSEYNVEEFDFDEAEPIKVTGFETFKAHIIDIATKIPNVESKQVIVVDDGFGSLLTVNDGASLFTIDNINDLDTNDIEIVSKVLMANIHAELSEKAEPITREILQNMKEEKTESTVNGVPTEV